MAENDPGPQESTKASEENPQEQSAADLNVSSSGVWEKSENKKWVVVRCTHHRIPCRSKSKSENTLDPSLSIHSYIRNFEAEEQSNTYSVINDGSSLIRVDSDDRNFTENNDTDPLEGTSSGSVMSNSTRRLAVKARRRSSHISSPEVERERRTTPILNLKLRRRKRKRKRKRHFENDAFSTKKKKICTKEIILSVESSPGRDCPSPGELQRIIENSLNLYRSGEKICRTTYTSLCIDLMDEETETEKIELE